jgi:hypothetical protein
LAATTDEMVSRPRRIAFWVLLVLVVVAGVELLSLVALSVINHRLTAYGQLNAQRAAALLDAGWPAELPELRLTAGAALFRRHEVIHPYVGFVEDPTAHWTAPREGYDRRAGELGFPDNKESLFQEPSDKRAVLGVFGGSVAALFASHGGGAELARLLQEIPRFAGKRVSVLCLAAPGYKQPQQLMILNYLLTLGARFNVVLNIDGFNEVAIPPADHMRSGVFPHYPRGWYVRVADLDPEMRKALGAAVYLRDGRARRAAAFSRFPLRSSLTAGLVWTVLDRRIQSEASRYEALLFGLRRASEVYQTRGPRAGYRTEAELFRDLSAVWRRSSLLMHRLCASSGIEYYHILQPNQYVPGSKPMGQAERERAWRADHEYRHGVEAGYPYLIEAGARLRSDGVCFHDLTRVFADVRNAVYEDDCCHFNRLGRRILAAEIAKIMASERCVGGGGVRSPTKQLAPEAALPR